MALFLSISPTTTLDYILLKNKYESENRIHRGLENLRQNAEAIYLGVLIKRNVSHLFARIKQTIFSTLAKDVLKSSNIHSFQKRRHTKFIQ